MVHAVASRKATRKNEDLAIINIAHLLGNVLDFDVVDEILREFFNARRIVIIDIQSCCLGQAYVRFDTALDRDVLIQ